MFLTRGEGTTFSGGRINPLTASGRCPADETGYVLKNEGVTAAETCRNSTPEVRELIEVPDRQKVVLRVVELSHLAFLGEINHLASRNLFFQ